jgi:hypothetical protein
MKKFNITYICPVNGRQVTELDVNANRLFHNDGETWFKYDDTCGWYNPETRQEEFRVCEVITATLCTDTQAKAAYMERFGTASE